MNKIKITSLSIEGCFLIDFLPIFDDRGVFVKTFNRDIFKGTALQDFSVEEEFFTKSHKNVIRGMHFQTPPFDHNKIVSCNDGKVTDVLVDIRVKSKSFGEFCSIDLSSEAFQCLYIPSGIAHGFVSRSAYSTMSYKVDKIYSAENDKGIAWNSFCFDWNCDNPVISNRDRNFPSLDEFNSPF